MMWLKKGVSLKGLQAPIVTAMLLVDSVTPKDVTWVITRGTEHAPNSLPDSLHPQGHALDIRMVTDEMYPDWRSRIYQVFDDTEFDVVFYDSHLHIEFDPKGGKSNG